MDLDVHVCCDLCDTPVEDFEHDLFHHSGILKGKFSGHIHVCKLCHAQLNLPEVNFDLLQLPTRKHEA